MSITFINHLNQQKFPNVTTARPKVHCRNESKAMTTEHQANKREKKSIKLSTKTDWKEIQSKYLNGAFTLQIIDRSYISAFSMSESSSVFNIFPIAYVQGKQLEKYQELIILMWFFYGNYLLCGETNENRRVSIK